MIANVVIPKKRIIKCSRIARRSMIASGRLKAEIAIINAKAVPSGIPF